MSGILAKFEDPNHPLLGPTLYILKIWHVWQPNRRNSKFWYNIVHILGTLFVVTQYIELWFIRSNLELAMKNLSFTMLATTCLVKADLFILMEKKWYSVIDYVSDLEKRQLSLNDEITNSVIRQYTKYSRTVTYFYGSLTAATVFVVILTPLFGYYSFSNEHQFLIKNGTLPYPEMLSAWLPFDRTRGMGYWISVIEHIAIILHGGGIVAAYDSTAVALMSFFAGQLKLISINCSKMFDGDGDEMIRYEDAVRKIREYHHHHANIVKYSSALNSLLSPVMFLYVIICSLMICANAIQLTKEGTVTMQRIWIAEYLLALIAQLFLYCWHCNVVLLMVCTVCAIVSEKVYDGVYASKWWAQNVRVRRIVLLLGGQLRKRIIFTAGPFTDLRVATFVTILKSAYSYYALLSNNEV